MSSSARDQVRDLINKRSKRILDIKRNKTKMLDINQVVKKFIQTIEIAHKKAQGDPGTFDSELRRALVYLEKDVQIIDKFVKSVSVIWGEDAFTNMSDSPEWSRLAVEGIEIVWSDSFVSKTGVSAVTRIDVGHLFLEGYL